MQIFNKTGKVGRRLFISISSIILIPLFISASVIIIREVATIKNSTFHELGVINKFTESRVLHLLKYLKGQTHSFCADAYIKEVLKDLSSFGFLSENRMSGLNTYLSSNKLPLMSEVVETFILNNDGMVVASSGELQIGKSYAGYDWFRKSVGNVVVSDIFYDNNVESLTWVIIAPLEADGSNRNMGYLLNRIDYQVLNDIVTSTDFSTLNIRSFFKEPELASQSYIVNRNGITLTDKNSSVDKTLNKTFDVELLDLQTTDKGSDVLRFSDYNGVDSVGVCSVIDGTDLFLISKVNNHLVMDMVKLVVTKSSLYTILLCFFISLLVFITIRKLIGPLVVMSESLDRIVGGNFKEKVNFGSENSEIGEIANSFNTLVAMVMDSSRSLNESEMRFQSMVEDIPVMIAVFDNQRGFIVWNKECELVTGYDSDVILNNDKSLELLYPDSINYEYVMSKWVNRGTDYRNWEMQLKCKDGDVKAISWSNLSVQFPVSGWEKWVVGVDVTVEKQMKNDLVEKTIYLDNILRSSADIGIVTMDMDFSVKYFNPSASRIFGYRPDEIVGRTAADLQKKTGIDPEQFLYSLDKVESGDEHRFILDYEKGREKLYIEIRISGILDIACKLIGIVMVAQDITVRKKTEEELELYVKKLANSNTELEQFAYVASHDLQEPLRMISSYLQLLEQRYKGQLDKEADEFIWYAVDGAKRMQELINALLLLSRVGTCGGEFVKVDCASILKQVMINLQPVISESGAVITMGDLPVIIADKSQMGQLFQNLIANAVKFKCDKSPEIEICAEQMDDNWIFSINDNGIGIDAEQFNRIFLMFQRLHSRSEFEGTGIGLSMCKKIVERHGGKIWVKSEPAKGSVFYFSLPVKPVSQVI